MKAKSHQLKDFNEVSYQIVAVEEFGKNTDAVDKRFILPQKKRLKLLT